MNQTQAVRALVRVRGRVQGVSFRANTELQARALGLVGYVCNEADGSVRALAEGPREALDAWIGWCRRGPPHARVDATDVEWSCATGEFDDFHIRR